MSLSLLVSLNTESYTYVPSSLFSALKFPVMDSRTNLCVFLVCVVSLLFSNISAYKFYVGGREGWALKPSEDYNHWAGRNRFQVNDTIYFKYEKGSDSVLLVNQQDFESCKTENPIKKFEDGNSEFKFDRSGPFCFISGEDDRCKNGQKLIVVVLAVRPIRRGGGPPPQTLPSPVSQPPSVFPSPPSQSPMAAHPPQTHYPAPSASPTSPPLTPSGAPSGTAIPPTSSSPAPSASPASPSTAPSPVESTPASSSPASSTSPVSPSESPAASSPTSTGKPLSPPSPAGAETTPPPGGAGGSADTTAVPPPGSNKSTANSLMGLSVTTAISVALCTLLAV